MKKSILLSLILILIPTFIQSAGPKGLAPQTISQYMREIEAYLAQEIPDEESYQAFLKEERAITPKIEALEKIGRSGKRERVDYRTQLEAKKKSIEQTFALRHRQEEQQRVLRRRQLQELEAERAAAEQERVRAEQAAAEQQQRAAQAAAQAEEQRKKVEEETRKEEEAKAKKREADLKVQQAKEAADELARLKALNEAQEEERLQLASERLRREAEEAERKFKEEEARAEAEMIRQRQAAEDAKRKEEEAARQLAAQKEENDKRIATLKTQIDSTLAAVRKDLEARKEFKVVKEQIDAIKELIRQLSALDAKAGGEKQSLLAKLYTDFEIKLREKIDGEFENLRALFGLRPIPSERIGAALPELREDISRIFDQDVRNKLLAELDQLLVTQINSTLADLNTYDKLGKPAAAMTNADFTEFDNTINLVQGYIDHLSNKETANDREAYLRYFKDLLARKKAEKTGAKPEVKSAAEAGVQLPKPVKGRKLNEEEWRALQTFKHDIEGARATPYQAKIARQKIQQRLALAKNVIIQLHDFYELHDLDPINEILIKLEKRVAAKEAVITPTEWDQSDELLNQEYQLIDQVILEHQEMTGLEEKAEREIPTESLEVFQERVKAFTTLQNFISAMNALEKSPAVSGPDKLLLAKKRAALARQLIKFLTRSKEPFKGPQLASKINNDLKLTDAAIKIKQLPNALTYSAMLMANVKTFLIEAELMQAGPKPGLTITIPETEAVIMPSPTAGKVPAAETKVSGEMTQLGDVNATLNSMAKTEPTTVKELKADVNTLVAAARSLANNEIAGLPKTKRLQLIAESNVEGDLHTIDGLIAKAQRAENEKQPEAMIKNLWASAWRAAKELRDKIQRELAKLGIKTAYRTKKKSKKKVASLLKKRIKKSKMIEA
jgi:hypothetical protein